MAPHPVSDQSLVNRSRGSLGSRLHIPFDGENGWPLKLEQSNVRFRSSTIRNEDNDEILQAFNGQQHCISVHGDL